ncbi:YaaC family protein [Streptomyces hydrogenans]|uniref:YaaC family protein n=1 Tax=Streptomyces hydrogenans TaxID=1873719 RepID=UPI0035DA17D1
MVFSASLEQSEQLFDAARGVGYASRPLLLFYGISQAGRAIAASSQSANGEEWKLSSHGITADIANFGKLGKVNVRDKGDGSFTRLAPLLKSSTLKGGVPLGVVWSAVPELASTPLEAPGEKLFPPLSYSHQHMDSEPINGGTVCVIYGRLLGAPSRLLRRPDERKISEFLENYPTLLGSEDPGPSMTPVTRNHGGIGCNISRRWVGEEDPTNLELRTTTPYLGDDVRYAFAGFGEDGLPFHPFLGWWAVLYSLSMLARYHPAKWAEMLNIDSSPDAAIIEHALDKALDVVPELIYYLIRAAQ